MELPGIITYPKGNLIPQDGSLTYESSFLSPDEARHFFNVLKETVRWRSEKIRIYGKEVLQPRLMAWYGDKGRSYTYSHLTLHPDPWTKELAELKTRVEAASKLPFNSLLLNYYRDGRDHVSWHSDYEVELGRRPAIAALSLGGVGRFQLRHKTNKDLETLSLDLEPGSLVVMSGSLQEFWLHRIAQTKKHVDERISLTYRQII